MYSNLYIYIAKNVLAYYVDNDKNITIFIISIK